MTICRYCETPIHLVHSPHGPPVWVDDTDGDGCGDAPDENTDYHGVHAP